MKILMVCLGNICRSPLAEGVLQQLADEAGLAWKVSSAGTGNWHVGSSPDKRSIAVAKNHGVDISQQRAQQLSKSDFEYYDFIFVMDKSNLKDVLAFDVSESNKQKVRLFLEDEIVPDPYYNDAQFEPVYQLIADRCLSIVQEGLFL